MTRLVLWFALMGLSPSAYGFMPNDEDGTASDRSFRLRSTLEDQQINFQAALQLKQDARDGLGLQDSYALLGESNVTPERVLRELAPHLNRLVPELLDRKTRGTVVHEVFQLKFGIWALAQGRIELHHYGQKLVLLRVTLPDIASLGPVPVPSDFKSLADLAHEPWSETIKHVASYQILAPVSGELTPAWEIHGMDQQNGKMLQRIVDAKYGTVLQEKELDFKLTTVFSKNPKDGRLIDVTLPELTQAARLDGKYFSVFSPDETSPRATGQNGDFLYRPDTDGIHFDEVQSYYYANKALNFFREKFGLDAGTDQIKIRVHHDMDGKPDNAYYVPHPSGPEIRIGRGEKLKNLARDIDVISHEFAHHVIYRHLRETKGEAGVLHEGTADYFAYAISNDPYLGESVSPTKDFVRTATTADKDKYHLLPASTKTHVRGSYWSAVLWEIRQSLGSDYADLLVYESLPYLGQSGTIKDGFLALLSADRDLSARPSGDAIPLYGENKCTILASSIKLGFATFLENFDGSSCGIDLSYLAEEARAQMLDAGKSTQGGHISRVPLKACGTVLSSDDSTRSDTVSFLLLFITPVVLYAWRRRIPWISIKS